MAGPEEKDRQGLFPATQLSAFALLRSQDDGDRETALERIVSAYWRPVYVYVRLKWRKSAEEGRDLTQEFFASALERRTLDGYDPDRGRFRSYLRICLDRFLANEVKAGRRLKRGGPQASWLEVDVEDLEPDLAGALSSPDQDPEAAFDREWTRSIFALAVKDLRVECEAQGKTKRFLVFDRLVLSAETTEVPTYRDLAASLGITESDVSNYLQQAKRDLKRSLLARLRGITATDGELADEARAVIEG